MEMTILFKILRFNSSKIAISSIVFSLLFVVIYLVLPEKYFAEGTIYVYPVNNFQQKSEVSNELNYARNIIALSNSPEFKLQIIDLSTSNSYSPLIGVVGNIKLKEISPNILLLSVSGLSENEVESSYSTYFKSLKEFSEKLKRGNSSFEVVSLSEKPIINRVNKNLFQFIVLGFISGLFFSSIYFYYKRK